MNGYNGSDFLVGVLGKQLNELTNAELNEIDKFLKNTDHVCIHRNLGPCRPSNITSDATARITRFEGQLVITCEKHATMIRAIEKQSFVPVEYLKEAIHSERVRMARVQEQESNYIQEARNYIAAHMARRDKVDVSEVTSEQIDMYIENNKKEYVALLDGIRPKPRVAALPVEEPRPVRASSRSGNRNFGNKLNLDTAGAARH